jgi:hypothetical protein
MVDYRLLWKMPEKEINKLLSIKQQKSRRDLINAYEVTEVFEAIKNGYMERR